MLFAKLVSGRESSEEKVVDSDSIAVDGKKAGDELLKTVESPDQV